MNNVDVIYLGTHKEARRRALEDFKNRLPLRNLDVWPASDGAAVRRLYVFGMEEYGYMEACLHQKVSQDKLDWWMFDLPFKLEDLCNPRNSLGPSLFGYDGCILPNSQDEWCSIDSKLLVHCCFP